MHNASRNRQPNYETSDMHLKLILASGIFLVLAVLVTFAVGYGIMKTFNAAEPRDEYEGPSIATRVNRWETLDTRLQDNPGVSYKDHLKSQQEAAHAMGQISDTPEVYRIPVDKAVELVAEQGRLPEFKPLPAEQPVTLQSEKKAGGGDSSQ